MTKDELDALEEIVTSCVERALGYLVDEIHSANELEMQNAAKAESEGQNEFSSDK
jgi:hypothetical protein